MVFKTREKKVAWEHGWYLLKPENIIKKCSEKGCLNLRVGRYYKCKDHRPKRKYDKTKRIKRKARREASLVRGN